MQSGDVPDAISVRDAARIIGCKRSWIFKLIGKGELSFKREGRAFQLRKDEVVARARAGWRRVGVPQIK